MQDVKYLVECFCARGSAFPEIPDKWVHLWDKTGLKRVFFGPWELRRCWDGSDLNLWWVGVSQSSRCSWRNRLTWGHSRRSSSRILSRSLVVLISGSKSCWLSDIRRMVFAGHVRNNVDFSHKNYTKCIKEKLPRKDKWPQRGKAKRRFLLRKSERIAERTWDKKCLRIPSLPGNQNLGTWCVQERSPAGLEVHMVQWFSENFTLHAVQSVWEACMQAKVIVMMCTDLSPLDLHKQTLNSTIYRTELLASKLMVNWACFKLCSWLHESSIHARCTQHQCKHVQMLCKW